MRMCELCSPLGGSAKTPVPKNRHPAIIRGRCHRRAPDPMRLRILALLLSLCCSAAAQAPQATAVSKEKSLTIRPDAGDATGRLAAARRELALLITRHGEKHHLVQQQRRKVAELQKRATTEAVEKPAPSKATQLEAAKRELATMRERYTDQHPLVQNQLRRIAELEGGESR